MTYRVITQPSAEAEAEEIFRWIQQGSPGAAVRWYRGLREAIESLEQNPQRCPLAPENEFFEEEIHQLLYGKRRGVYRILFTIEDDVVSVLFIRHSARRVLQGGRVSEEDEEEA
jgi:plasmid stabilization system protein ParE